VEGDLALSSSSLSFPASDASPHSTMPGGHWAAGVLSRSTNSATVPAPISPAPTSTATTSPSSSSPSSTVPSRSSTLQPTVRVDPDFPRVVVADLCSHRQPKPTLSSRFGTFFPRSPAHVQRAEALRRGVINESRGRGVEVEVRLFRLFSLLFPPPTPERSLPQATTDPVLPPAPYYTPSSIYTASGPSPSLPSWLGVACPVPPPPYTPRAALPTISTEEGEPANETSGESGGSPTSEYVFLSFSFPSLLFPCNEQD
jgi:hypothetical protein